MHVSDTCYSSLDTNFQFVAAELSVYNSFHSTSILVELEINMEKFNLWLKQFESITVLVKLVKTSDNGPGLCLPSCENMYQHGFYLTLTC